LKNLVQQVEHKNCSMAVNIIW